MKIGTKEVDEVTHNGATLKVTKHKMDGFHTEIDLKDCPKLLDIFEDAQNKQHDNLRAIVKSLNKIIKKYNLEDDDKEVIDNIILSIKQQIKYEDEILNTAKKEVQNDG